MRGCIVSYDPWAEPLPKLSLCINHAPHRRMHRRALQQFREDLTRSAERSIGRMVTLPIDHEIDLDVMCVNPLSPDCDHLLEAVFMALDGKTLNGPSVLTDDRLIQQATIRKLYHARRVKRDPPR